jgi:hypothetical protein
MNWQPKGLAIMRVKGIAFALIALVLGTGNAAAQSDEDLAKAMANPLASVI